MSPKTTLPTPQSQTSLPTLPTGPFDEKDLISHPTNILPKIPLRYCGA